MVKKRVVNKKVLKKTVQNHNFFYDNFISGLVYIKKSWIFFIIAIVLIILASLVGYFGVIGIVSPGLENSINNYVTNSVSEIVKETQGLGPVQLTAFIMSNNIKTAFFGMLSGIFFAVSSLLIVIFNGYVLGFVAQKAVSSPLNPQGILVLWRLLPHGIFEIPAILISIGLGIKLGLYPFFTKEKGKAFLSLLVSFVIFLVLSGIIMVVLLSFSGGLSSQFLNPSENFSNLLNNPAFLFAFYILIALSFIISFVIGLKVLSLKDREIVKGILADSFRVFVFVVIPLLVIAGIIEGLLIYLVG
jgi:stage II sporulation protein M